MKSMMKPYIFLIIYFLISTSQSAIYAQNNNWKNYYHKNIENIYFGENKVWFYDNAALYSIDTRNQELNEVFKDIPIQQDRIKIKAKDDKVLLAYEKEKSLYLRIVDTNFTITEFIFGKWDFNTKVLAINENTSLNSRSVLLRANDTLSIIQIVSNKINQYKLNISIEQFDDIQQIDTSKFIIKTKNKALLFNGNIHFHN